MCLLTQALGAGRGQVHPPHWAQAEQTAALGKENIVSLLYHTVPLPSKEG